jgi:hypothetical protein
MGTMRLKFCRPCHQLKLADLPDTHVIYCDANLEELAISASRLFLVISVSCRSKTTSVG